MSISIKRCRTGIGVLVLLLLAVGRLAAQTSSTPTTGVKAIPGQVETTGESRLTTKTNTVTNKAADGVDTLGTKAYKGVINMFKKKKKKPVAAPKDSTNVHPTDSLNIAPKSSFVPTPTRRPGLVNDSMLRFRRRTSAISYDFQC